MFISLWVAGRYTSVGATPRLKTTPGTMQQATDLSWRCGGIPVFIDRRKASNAPTPRWQRKAHARHSDCQRKLGTFGRFILIVLSAAEEMSRREQLLR